MKKATILIFMLLTIVNIQAQDYLISFAGSGAASTVGTVKVDNITSGATLTMNGGDLLHLSGSVGITKLNSDKKNMQIYPNPMGEHSTLTFFAPGKGTVIIDIVDLSGKTIYQTSSMLTTGTHSFRVSGFNNGLYFVKVKGQNYSYTQKMISQCNLKHEPGIEYVSSATNPKINDLKSTESTIEMLYKNGDRLLFKGTSGIYSTIVSDLPTSSKTITFTFAACTDNDNNNYTIVKIGTQTWMAENLKSTKYNDGTSIPLVRDNTAWSGLSTPGYCWYNNDSITYLNFSGALYNWYTVNTAKLAPAGWHIPNDAEWTTLTNYVGGLANAGGKLKETGTTHWISPNTGATDEYGFSAVAGGFRFSGGDYTSAGGYGQWWSSTNNNGTTAWYRYITNNASNVNRFNGNNLIGNSVRCIKD